MPKQKQRVQNKGVACQMPICIAPARAQGLCKKHYREKWEATQKARQFERLLPEESAYPRAAQRTADSILCFHCDEPLVYDGPPTKAVMFCDQCNFLRSVEEAKATKARDNVEYIVAALRHAVRDHKAEYEQFLRDQLQKATGSRQVAPEIAAAVERNIQESHARAAAERVLASRVVERTQAYAGTGKLDLAGFKKHAMKQLGLTAEEFEARMQQFMASP